MNEVLIQAVTDRILKELGLPPALLVGKEPPESLGYRYVSQSPFEAVVIGSLTPGQLLCFRNEDVLQALDSGTPVFLYSPGLPGKDCKNPGLRNRYMSARRELKALGIQFTKETGKSHLICAKEAQRLKDRGCSVPEGARLTPLARDILDSTSRSTSLKGG